MSCSACTSRHLGTNKDEKLDLHLCDLVIALIVIGIIFWTLYKATNHDFVEVSTESCCDGLIEASSNNICNFLNLNLFLLLTQTFFLYLVFGDAQVYTGLALFLVSENNILNAFSKIIWIVTPSKPLEINLCLKIIRILDITG